MRGIATIDRQAGSDTAAVWITSRHDLAANHGNAVVIDLAGDPDAVEKVRSLTRCCAVLITDGTSLDGFPIEGDPITAADIDYLVEATTSAQRDIIAAVEEHRTRTRSKTLIDPTFPAPADRALATPRDATASARAYALANYMMRAWSSWLRTDEERRRRTVQPRTGKTPWIMPEEMNAADVPDFPATFTGRVREQELV